MTKPVTYCGRADQDIDGMKIPAICKAEIRKDVFKRYYLCSQTSQL